MRLLSIAESLKSPKRSNSTFKWLPKSLKVESMLDLSMKRDLRAFSKLRQRRKKCSLSSTSKLQLHKGFKVSRKPCLNLCSFKWLKRRRNLVRYLTPSGSLALNTNLFLGLIKERSLFLKTAIDSKFCISGASCDNSERSIWHNQFYNWKKVTASCVCHKSFY